MSLRAGDPAEIGGYPLEARLGSGGMGTVFLARTSSGRPVAIKLIHQQFAGDDEFRIRFRQEVAAARRVSGAFTAAVVDAAPEAEQPWMATTYIEGHTLAQHIATKGPLNGAELRRLAIGLAEALRDIHRVGVVHRDLKPSNVVLSPEGPRVIDFGISRAVDQQTLTMTGRVIGTPPFMSPEQLQAPRGVGPRSDVFSLGTLLVYSATGHGPFDAESPYMTAYQVVHEEPSLGAVPAALRAVVESCLDKEPERAPLGGRTPRAAAGPAVRPRRDRRERSRRGPHPRHDHRSITSRRRPPRRRPPRPPPRPVPIRGAPAPPSAADCVADGGPCSRPRSGTVAAIGGGVAALKAGGFGGTAAATRATALRRRVPHFRTASSRGARPCRAVARTSPTSCVASRAATRCSAGAAVSSRPVSGPVDGSRVWTAKSPGVPVQGMHLVGATDDTVLGYRFAAQDAPQGPPSEVVAIDADSGRELWSVPSGAQSTAVTGRTQDAIVVGSAVVTVDASNSRFEARDAHSGRGHLDDAVSRGYAVRSRPGGPTALRDVRDGCGGGCLGRCATPPCYPVDRASGTLGRPIAVDGPAVPMGVANGRLVLLQEHMEGTALAGYDGVARVDPASRKVTYSRLAKTYAGTPGMADGTVYVSGQTGLVTALDPATGRKKWSRQTGVEGASGPVAGAGALYFSSATGRVVALSPDDGKPLWTTDPQAEGLTGEQGASPRVTVAGRAVIVAAAKNTLFAFDAQKPPKSG